MPFIYLTDAGRDLPAPVQERVGTCLEHGLHCLVQTVGVHAVAGVEEFGVRDRDEVVRAAAADQLAGDACLCDTRADQLAETAEQVVVLRRDDAAGLCGVNDGLLVERLDREHIDDADFLAQLIVDALGGFHGKVDHDAGADERTVVALARDERLADLIFRILGIQGACGLAAKADVDRGVVCLLFI